MMAASIVGASVAIARLCGVAVHALITHRRELATTLLGGLRGAAHEDARGDACEEPAEGADDAGDASGEANHREDGAAAHACTAQCSHSAVIVQSCTHTHTDTQLGRTCM